MEPIQEKMTSYATKTTTNVSKKLSTATYCLEGLSGINL